MAAKRLKGNGNLADEIVDALFDGKNPADMATLMKSLLNLTLNDPKLDPRSQARMIAAICFEHGLNPPDRIKRRLL